MWGEGLRVRDVAFWEESGKQEFNLCKMLEARDCSMKIALELRDIEWLNSLQHCRDILRLTTQELINNRCIVESLGKRQREHVKGNAEILDWAKKIMQEERATGKHPNF